MKYLFNTFRSLSAHTFCGFGVVLATEEGEATAGNEIVISAVVTDFLAYNAAGDALAWG